MDNAQIFELADRLKAAKELKKDLDAQVKAVNAEIEQIDRDLSDAMTEQELDKFTRNGSTFYLNSRLFASPASGRKDELLAALKENGYGSLVTETVNANTLASFCKEQLAANEDALPAWLSDVISTFEKVTVGVRKA
jgi:hypothetical protein